jgi:23S rRNA pseudouridine955/2504/2580 synthase
VSINSQTDSTPDESTPATRSPVRRETIGTEDAGSRVDRVLARLLPTVPHTRLFRLLRKGEVRLNGKRVSGETRVAEGDILRVPPVALEMAPAAPVPYGGAPAAPRISTRLADQIQASIIHEDDRLLVVNKPAGVAVHGGSGVTAGVIEALRFARPDETLELVHRLDRDTSGCLLVARKRSTLRSLHALLRQETAGEEGGFDKRYLTLVRGKWELGKKRIDAPLRTDLRVGGERTVRVAADGKEAASEFRAVEFFGNLATLLEVRLFTGRTHQIRVHAAYAGHPVAGDEKYGDPEFNKQMQRFDLRRLFLHAHSISFEDPDERGLMSVSAPLPAELHAVIDSLTAGAGRIKPAGVTRAGVADERLVRPARAPAGRPRAAAKAARIKAKTQNVGSRTRGGESKAPVRAGTRPQRAGTRPPRPDAATRRTDRSAAGRRAPSDRGSRPSGKGSRRDPRS